MINITIYGLKDPRNNKIFYVGKTKRPKTRLQQHINEARLYANKHIDPIDRMFGYKHVDVNKSYIRKTGKNVEKIARILDIINSNQTVDMIILDEWQCYSDDDASKLEEAWIAQIRSTGTYLVNYIYSHRMNPWWYGANNPNYKTGWAKTPLEYIEKLKQNITENKDYQKTNIKTTLRQRRRYAKRNQKGAR